MNALPESEDVKALILKANPANQSYLELAAKEYKRMVEILEGGNQGSLVD